MSAESDDCVQKLSAARTRLILDKPFLGALVLRLPLKEAEPEWCPTTGTDAKHFYYNPEYIRALRPDEAQFVLAHEALHCALSHFARRGHRIKHRWDLACDYAVNPLLIEDGLTPPPDVQILDEYRGMTAEEIYPCLKDNDHSETMDQHLYDKQEQSEGGSDTSNNPLESKNRQSGDAPDPDPEQQKEEREQEQEGKGQEPQEQPSQQPDPQQEGDQQEQQQPQPQQSSEQKQPPPQPLNETEKSALSVQWQQRMAGAAQQAQQAGKIGGALGRMIEFMLQPQLPWRMLLARYMNTIARDDYSYTRPSSRRGDPAIYPSLRTSQMNAVIALDVSGSVTEGEMSEFISEVDAIKGQLRARIEMIACDMAISPGSPWVYEAWEACDLPKAIRGGGGTNFLPVFEWVEQQDRKPDVLVYFTDAKGKFPEFEPDYPVIWLVKGKKSVPWGQRIQLN